MLGSALFDNSDCWEEEECDPSTEERWTLQSELSSWLTWIFEKIRAMMLIQSHRAQDRFDVIGKKGSQ